MAQRERLAIACRDLDLDVDLNRYIDFKIPEPLYRFQDPLRAGILKSI